jgi:hypothetical protein
VLLLVPHGHFACRSPHIVPAQAVTIPYIIIPINSHIERISNTVHFEDYVLKLHTGLAVTVDLRHLLSWSPPPSLLLHFQQLPPPPSTSSTLFLSQVSEDAEGMKPKGALNLLRSRLLALFY